MALYDGLRDERLTIGNVERIQIFFCRDMVPCLSCTGRSFDDPVVSASHNHILGL